MNSPAQPLEPGIAGSSVVGAARYASLVLVSYLAHDAQILLRAPVSNSQEIAAFAFLAIAGWFLSRFALWWVAGAAVLVYSCLVRPYDLANHHFVLLYTCLGFAIACGSPPEQRAALLRSNLGRLIAVIMTFAVLHRCLSPSFLNGDYFGFSFATGAFGRLYWHLGLNPEAVQTMVANAEGALAYANRFPIPDTPLVLEQPFPAFQFVTLASVYLILLLEIAIATGFFFASRTLWPHILTVLLVASLFLIRLESHFMAVLTVLGLASLPEGKTWLRPVYAALGISALGFYYLIGYSISLVPGA